MFRCRCENNVPASLLTRPEPYRGVFVKLKAFIRRHSEYYKDNPNQGFDNFLEWCVSCVGVREKSVNGHFRYAGVNVDET
jgi:hypothetical protein